MDNITATNLFLMAGLIDKDEVKTVLEENSKKSGEKIEDTMVRLHFASEQELTKVYAKHLGVPYIELSCIRADQKAISSVPMTLANQHNVLPVWIEDNTLFLAMENPENKTAIESVQSTTGMNVKPHMCAPIDIASAIDEYYHVDESINEYIKNVSYRESIELLSGSVSSAPASKQDEAVQHFLNAVLFQSLSNHAESVMLQPRQKDLLILNQIDGISYEAMHAPKWIIKPFVSYIKAQCRMPASETSEQQQGQIKIRVEENVFECKIIVQSGVYGSHVYIRFINPHKRFLALDELGFSPDLVSDIKHTIHSAKGTLLLCGTSGSGRTTTLYSLLADALRHKQIVTLENPVEHPLAGAKQVCANESSGISRSLYLETIFSVQQDIVYAGDILDRKIAENILQASLKNRLVMGSMHAKSSIAGIRRLLDMPVPPDLAATGLCGVLTQKLVRTLCDHCRTPHEPSEEDAQKIQALIGREPDFVLYKGKGCVKCRRTGYQGRIGIFEFLKITDPVRAIIRQNPDSAQLKEAVEKNTMKTLLNDAMDKLQQGITTWEEIKRVILTDCDDLPAASGDDSLAASLPDTNDFKGFKIHICDDEPAVAHLFEKHLKHQGFCTNVSYNGKQALEKIAVEKPHLLVIDVMMPELNGLEVIKTLKQDVTTAFIPIMIISNKNTARDKLKGYESGTDDYLPKPFLPQELLIRVKSLLKRVYV